MDTTLPANQGMASAIDVPGLHHAFCWVTIAAGTAVAFLSRLAGVCLLRSVNDPARSRHSGLLLYE